jgi:gas vesicle protein
MEQRDSGCCSGTILLSLFIGGLVGAGVALLVAPKTGEETRRMIKELAEDTKTRAEDWIDKVKDKATSYVEKGKEFIEKETNVITRSVEAGKEAYEKETQG